MKLTSACFRQHIGWHFQNHWKVQGKRKPIETGAEQILKNKGIYVENPNQFLREKKEYEKVILVGHRDQPQPLDKTHPNWHDKPLLTLKDNNVLLEGLTQAKILTNTVEVKQGLPEKYQLPDITREFNKKIKKIILGTHILDAEQKKLPKVKDPARPAWNFPRSYGVTQNRVFKLLVSKLLNLIETSTSLDLVEERFIAHDLYFSFPFEKYGGIIQFQLLGDIVLLSNKYLNPITTECVKGFDLPDIFPIKPTITLNEENIYVVEDIYSINNRSKKFHPHTLIINFDKENVKNLFEEEVTEEQIYGRSLLKTFTAAASYARAYYGNDKKELPKPVTLQSIQTDGRRFYFGVLQLNTLDTESTETRNIWYRTDGINLFETCSYRFGRPELEGYNKEVARHLLAFYNNI